jgi:hypothetical protein
VDGESLGSEDQVGRAGDLVEVVGSAVGISSSAPKASNCLTASRSDPASVCTLPALASSGVVEKASRPAAPPQPDQNVQPDVVLDVSVCVPGRHGLYLRVAGPAAHPTMTFRRRERFIWPVRRLRYRATLNHPVRRIVLWIPFPDHLGDDREGFGSAPAPP